MLAAAMPGLGNPMTDIDVKDFNQYMERVGAVVMVTSGKATDHDLVKLEQGVY